MEKIPPFAWELGYTMQITAKPHANEPNHILYHCHCFGNIYPKTCMLGDHCWDHPDKTKYMAQHWNDIEIIQKTFVVNGQLSEMCEESYDKAQMIAPK